MNLYLCSLLNTDIRLAKEIDGQTLSFENTKPYNDYFDCGDFSDRSLYVRSHNISWVKNLDPKSFILVVLIRDYKENFFHALANSSKVKREESLRNFVRMVLMDRNVISKRSNYISILDFFDKFSGKKYLMYYEDLLLNTREELIKLAEFLEVELLTDKKYALCEMKKK